MTIRSTFIVGFPGETEGEFEELLSFLDEAQLDRVGCFAYSPVDGAAANALPGAVAAEVKEERRERFMTRQAAISARRLASRIGSTQRVLVDAHVEIRKGRRTSVAASARGIADAPEIDGAVLIEDGADLVPGTFAEVAIFGADAHDLFARAA